MVFLKLVVDMICLVVIGEKDIASSVAGSLFGWGEIPSSLGAAVADVSFGHD